MDRTWLVGVLVLAACAGGDDGDGQRCGIDVFQQPTCGAAGSGPAHFEPIKPDPNGWRLDCHESSGEVSYSFSAAYGDTVRMNCGVKRALGEPGENASIGEPKRKGPLFSCVAGDARFQLDASNDQVTVTDGGAELEVPCVRY